MRNVKREEVATDLSCEKCGSPMVIKGGRRGEFLACSRYPDCKTTRAITLGVPCPECGLQSGGMVTEKRTKKGKSFTAATNTRRASLPRGTSR